MNNGPAGKRDVANVSSKYLKSVPNVNVSWLRAKDSSSGEVTLLQGLKFVARKMSETTK